MASRNGGQINFNVGFNVDKTSLNGLSQSLQNIAKQADSLGSSNGLDKQFKEAAAAASQLDSILKESWNTKLNQLNLDKLNKGIKDSYGGVDQLKQKLYQAGEQGQRAFVDFATQVLNTNIQLKESSKLLDSMATSMANTVKWGITSGVFNSMTGAIQSAYGYAKNLDTSLNNIRIVTGDSANQMERFAEMANRSAKDLGRSTLDYTKAALSYYQQGLSQEDVRARTETTLKAQNITGIGSEMVDYLTAVWNGFQVSAENAEAVVDKLALVADKSASDMSELAIAMSKVAATANVMGVDIDQLNAQIATVVAVTRQAPESVGTAFKTIYSRLNDIAAGADDAEVSLGNYSGQMATLGFNVLDANGKLRDTGEVIEQIGGKWDTLSKEQQVALAKIMGGTRQVTQISALFENWDMYSQLLNDSLNAQGTLAEKNAIYMESLAAQLERLGAETERTYSILFDTEGYNSLVNVGTKALEMFNNFIDGLGGGVNVLTYFGSLAVNIFSKQIAQSIVKTEQNLKSFLSNTSKIKEEIIKTAQADVIANNPGITDKSAFNEQVNAAAKVLQVQKGLTQQQYKASVELQKQIGLSKQKLVDLEKEEQVRQQELKALIQTEHLQGKTNEYIQNRITSLQEAEELNSKTAIVINKIDFTLQDIQDQTIQGVQAAQRRLSLAEQLSKEESNLLSVWEGQGKSSQEFAVRFKNIIEGLKTGNTSSRQFVNSWTALKGVFEQVHHQQSATLKNLNDYTAKTKSSNAELIKQENERLNTLNKQNDAIAEQGKRVLNTQNLVKGLSVAGQLVSSAVGVVSTFMDEAATGADKANAAFTGVQGAVTAIGSAFGPVGMGIATLANGALSLLRQIPGIGEWWEDLFTSATEKAQEFNDAIGQARTADLTSNKQIVELQSIQEEYNTLSEKVGQYGRNIDSLTDEEKNRYYELTDKFSQYNNAVIEGYDAQGHAIVRGQQALQDTIELLRQAKEESIAAKLGSVQDIDKGIRSTWESSEQYQGMQTKKAQVKDRVDDANMYVNQQTYATQNVKLPKTLQALLDYRSDLYQAFEVEDKIAFADFMTRLENGELQQHDQQAKAFADFIQKNQELIVDTLNAASTMDASKLKFDDRFTGMFTKYAGAYIASIREFTTNSNIDLDKEYQQIEETTEKINYSGEALYGMFQSVTNSQYNTSAQYQALRKKIDPSSESQLQQLINDYIATFTMDVDPEHVRAQVNEYIRDISIIFDNKTLQNAIKEASSNFDPSKISGDQYAETLRKVIQGIVDSIDNFNKYDDTARQALIDLLSNVFGLQGVKIEIGENAEVSTDAIDAQTRDVLDEAKAYVSEQYDQYGQAGLTIGKADLKKFLNADELQNPLDILGKIDWTEYFGLKNGGESWQSAFRKVLDKARGIVEEQAPSVFESLNLNQILGNDELVKNLTNKKKLTEAEEEYLRVIEQEFPHLQEIRDIQGRDSNAYIGYLQQIQSEIRKRYQEELQGRLEASKIQEQTLRNSITENMDAETKKSIQDQITEKLIEQAKIKYEMSMIDAKDLEVLKQMQQAEQERLNARRDRNTATAERTATNLSNSGSALDTLRSGQQLGSDEAAALAALEKQHAELAQIKNKYSLEYINLLDKILGKERQSNYEQQQAIILSGKRNQLEQINATIIAKENELEGLKYAASMLATDEILTQTDHTLERTENANKQVQLQNELLSLTQDRATLEGDIFALETEAQGTLADGITNMRTALDDFNSAMGVLIEGDSLSTDEWDHLNDILDEVLQKYPELQTQIELLHWEELAGTQAYAEAIQDVRQALNELNLTELAEEFNDAYNDLPNLEINVELNEDEVQQLSDQLDDLINVDRVINIEIETDAEETFHRLQEEFSNLYDAAGKIGENFVVAAEDLQLLNQVFPGIIQGMQLLDDGSYQLSSNVVQRAIATAETTASADAESTKEQLTHQATMLHTKAEIYKQMALAAYTLAGVETQASLSTAEAQEIISVNLAKLKEMNDSEAAEKILNNQKDITNSSDDESKKTAKNWAEAASSITRSIATLASQAIENFKRMAQANADAAQGKVYTGPASSYSLISSTYSGSRSTADKGNFFSNILNFISDGISDGISTIRDKLSGNASANFEYGDLSKEQWKEIGDKFSAAALATENQANKIDALIAQLGAETLDLSKGLENVRRGEGIKGIEPTSSGSDKGKKSGDSGGGNKSKKSGDSNKQKEPKEEKVQEPEFIQLLEELPDRYHDVDIAIKKVAKQLESLTKQQKKLYGKELLENLNKQIAALQKQIKLYEHKIEIAKIEQKQLRDSLQSYGVMFDDASGAITNYEEIFMKRWDALKTLIDWYNTLSKEEQDRYEKMIEKARADFEEFKKQISRYDEILTDVIPSLQQSIQDARDEIIEKQIQKFTMSIELQLDLAQAEREWNEFKRKVIDQTRDDDILGNVAARMADFDSYYKPGGGGIISELTKTVNIITDQVKSIQNTGTSSIYGDNMAKAVQDMKNYSRQLMSNLEDVEDLIKEVKQAFFDMIDAAQKAFDEQVKEYEFIGKLIDHDKKLIELVYGDKQFEAMARYHEQQRLNDNQQVDFLRQQKEMWKEQMDAQKARMDALDKQSNAYKEAEDRFKALQEQWISSVEAFNDKVEESIEHLLDAYENTLNKIFDDLDKKLTDGKGLEYIGEEWELINMNADRYLDKINSMYALEQLQYAYQSAIDNTKNNVKAQQALNNLMKQQLGVLSQKEKISKYDVDRANALLQVEIQRLALEDARNAKSKLRLRRDSQGNYSYQYTSDEDEMAKIQQDLLAAQNQVYNLDKNKYRENLQEVYKLQTEFNDKLQDLYLQYPVWTEQAEAKRKLLVEQYGIAINDLVRDNGDIRRNLQESTLDSIKLAYTTNNTDYAQSYKDLFIKLGQMYAANNTSFKTMTDADKTALDAAMQVMVPQWDTGIQTMIDKINKEGGFQPVCVDAFEALKTASGEYKEKLEELDNKAGGVFRRVKDGMDKDVTSAKTLLEKNEALVSHWDNSLNTMRDYITKLDEMAAAYNAVKWAAIHALEAARALWSAQANEGAAASAADTNAVLNGEDPTEQFQEQIEDWVQDDFQQSVNDPNKNANIDPTQGITGDPNAAANNNKQNNSKIDGLNVDDPQSLIGKKILFHGDYYDTVKGAALPGAQHYDWFATDTSQTYDPLKTKEVVISAVWDNTSEQAKYWQGESIVQITNPDTGIGLGWIRTKQVDKLSSYDTGGYTGSWGNTGKISMLHEKELVLNKQDTANILQAVDMTRSMEALLRNLNFGMNPMLAALGSNSSPSLDQNIVINASFPNASNRYEIEQAFENLLNRASQYISTPRL